MGVSEILAQIDHEIAQLAQARALLAGFAAKSRKVVAAPAAKKVAKKRKKKRNLSRRGGSVLPKPSSAVGRNRRKPRQASNWNHKTRKGWLFASPFRRRKSPLDQTDSPGVHRTT